MIGSDSVYRGDRRRERHGLVSYKIDEIRRGGDACQKCELLCQVVNILEIEIRARWHTIHSASPHSNDDQGNDCCAHRIDLFLKDLSAVSGPF